MFKKLCSLPIAATLMSGAAMADVPNVAVDIAPVHSLVARIMDGVGTPHLIIPPGASPHEYSLRPSEATALQNADMVFWLGGACVPLFRFLSLCSPLVSVIVVVMVVVVVFPCVPAMAMVLRFWLMIPSTSALFLIGMSVDRRCCNSPRESGTAGV